MKTAGIILRRMCTKIMILLGKVGKDGRAMVRALISHQYDLGLIPRFMCRNQVSNSSVTWVEFVFCSHPCSRRFLSGYCGFPSSQFVAKEKNLMRLSLHSNNYELICIPLVTYNNINSYSCKCTVIFMYLQTACLVLFGSSEDKLSSFKNR